jgi:hypothetical protein
MKPDRRCLPPAAWRRHGPMLGLCPPSHAPEGTAEAAPAATSSTGIVAGMIRLAIDFMAGYRVRQDGPAVAAADGGWQRLPGGFCGNGECA